MCNVPQHRFRRAAQDGFTLFDMLIVMACTVTGILLGLWLVRHLHHVPAGLRLIVFLLVCPPFSGLWLYLALVCPIYRALKFRPLLLPKCPCCGVRRVSYDILSRGWPSSTLQCPGCKGEFRVWFNGKPGKEETWERPVLTLNWPYIFGRYNIVQKPKRSAAPR
jgi:hypothetical protein